MHAIRLREPWQTALQESGPNSLRSASYHRRFNSPTGLTAQQTVWLVLQPIASPPLFAIDNLSINLNGQPLFLAPSSHDLSSHDSPSRVPPDTTTHRVSIAPYLQPFNILELTFPLAATSDSPPPLAQLVEVRLEIT